MRINSLNCFTMVSVHVVRRKACSFGRRLPDVRSKDVTRGQPQSDLRSFVLPDVSSVPASGDGFAVSPGPLHRAGGEAADKRGVVSGSEPAGPLHQLQTHTVQLPET